MYLIGYDIGSSTVKAALIDADSHQTIRVVQYPNQEMDMIARQSGWAEQQPEVWWQNVCIATQKLLDATDVLPSSIKGVGIAYQMHGLVLIDKEKNVLRPSIIWCDSRAVSLGDQAFKELGEKYCLEHLLNSPGNFTASKLKWVKDNEPDIFEKIDKILLPGDFIAMKLTGETATTIAGLSEGMFWDFKEKELSQKLLEYFGFDEEMIAERVPTFSIQGKVSQQAARQTGLAKGTPIAYRAGDQPNNALSLGILRPGEMAATCGTSGVVYGIVDRPIYDHQSRVNAFAHVNYEHRQDRIGTLLCINGAGIEYSWMKHQIARKGRSYQDMERMVAAVPVGSEGVCILPFGNGSERILANKNLNAHIYNLEFNRHTRAHLYRASLEGVAFSFVYGINILKEMGLDLDVIRVGNDNMFQSKTFSTTLATLLGVEIEVIDTTGAVGAAKAAGVATGIYQSLDEALSGLKPTIIHKPSFNKGQCDQAYTYWNSCLENALINNHNQNKKEVLASDQSQSLRKELKIKTKELAASAYQVHTQKEVLEELNIALTEAISKNNIKAIKSILQTQLKKIEPNLGPQEAWNKFEENFDLINSDFYKRLKGQFPKLSVDELKICHLIKMGLTTKEIAIRLNLSTRGIETRRYRLGKKLGLNKQNSLAKFIQLY